MEEEPGEKDRKDEEGEMKRRSSDRNSSRDSPVPALIQVSMGSQEDVEPGVFPTWITRGSPGLSLLEVTGDHPVRILPWEMELEQCKSSSCTHGNCRASLSAGSIGVGSRQSTVRSSSHT